MYCESRTGQSKSNATLSYCTNGSICTSSVVWWRKLCQNVYTCINADIQLHTYRSDSTVGEGSVDVLSELLLCIASVLHMRTSHCVAYKQMISQR
jgi:hypothetical protein